MKTEFIVWGIPPNQTMEDVLMTNATSLDMAQRQVQVLESKYGCTNCRIQILNLRDKPDFTKAINI